MVKDSADAPGGKEVVGGELLSTADWAPHDKVDGVHVTDAARGLSRARGPYPRPSPAAGEGGRGLRESAREARGVLVAASRWRRPCFQSKR